MCRHLRLALPGEHALAVAHHTVDALLVELGEEAVDRLLFRIANPTDSIRNIQLACRMTVGQTTAAAGQTT